MPVYALLISKGRSSMNIVFQRIIDIYTTTKNWLFPPENACTHCDPMPQDLSGIAADIKFEGRVIGTAYNVGLTESGLYASSLVLKNEDLDRLFMNGVAIANSQKDGFALVCGHNSNHATGVYLVSSNVPILAKYRGEEQVWLNKAMMECETVEWNDKTTSDVPPDTVGPVIVSNEFLDACRNAGVSEPVLKAVEKQNEDLRAGLTPRDR
jgi:hypothetical protein